MKVNNVVLRNFKRFRADKRGNLSMMFAFSLPVLVMFTGMAVDYSRLAGSKAQLAQAADTAILSAVSAMWDTAENGGSIDIDKRKADAKRVFLANASSSTGINVTQLDVNISQSVANVEVKLDYRADVPMSFGGVFNMASREVAGHAEAVKALPPYIDFYLLLDASASMGLPSSVAGQKTLFENTGCMFACHFTNDHSTYDKAGTLGVELRIDELKNAITGPTGFLETAAAAKYGNRYRVGAYSFVRYMVQNSPINGSTAYVTTTKAALKAAVNAIPLDTGDNAAYGSGGTHFENVLPSMTSAITNIGDGSAASKPRPFVFMVTDGAQDNQTQFGGNWSLPGGRATQVQSIDTALCQALKNKGVTVAVLYTTYADLNPDYIVQYNRAYANYYAGLPFWESVTWNNGQDKKTYTNLTDKRAKTFYHSWDDPFATDSQTNAANKAIPGIPTALTACASPGFFYTATVPGDIDKALKAMFQQAVNATRISK